MDPVSTEVSPTSWFHVRLRQLRRDARAWFVRRRLELWVLVGAWMLVSLAVFMLAIGHESPRRYQDEFLFWSVAKAFAGGDGLTWRGEGIGLYFFLYPVLLAPAFWIGGSVPESYTIVHLLNSLMIAGVVFPAYLLARQFFDHWRQAAVAALFAVSVPAMNYAGIIGTESLAYPVATAALAGLVLSIARPRRRNWALALALIAAAVLTRAQFVVLAPVFLVATIFAGLMLERSARRDYWRVQREPTMVMVAGFAAIGAAFLIKGHGVVGLYAGVFDGITPTFSDLAYWVKSLAADIYIFTAVIPAIATFALLLNRENRRDPLVGALLAVTIVATVAFIAQVALFSSINPYNWRTRHIFYERYMFYLAPLFFTGMLVAWRRVSVGAALVSSIFAVIVMTGFQTDAVLIPFSYDSFAMTLIGSYMDVHADVVPRIGKFLAGLTALMAALYCISRIERSTVARLIGIACIVLSFGILMAGQINTWQLARLYSHDSFKGFPKPVTFIDRNTDKDVGIVITSTDSPEMYFTAEFWNDRIVRAFATDASPIKTPVMYSPRCTFDWAESGEILGTGCDKIPAAYYMRSDNVSLHLRDEVKRVHQSPLYPNITLMEARPPARILSLSDGLNVITGEVQNAMNIRTFLDRPGALRLQFVKSKRDLAVTAGGGRPVSVPSGAPRSVTFQIRAGERVTTLRVKSPTGVPEVAELSDVQLREAGGEWVSIR